MNASSSAPLGFAASVKRATRRALTSVARVTLSRPLGRNPNFEHAMCLILQPQRLALPQIALDDLFEKIPAVSVDRLPHGSWSSPVVDMVNMARIVAALRPRRAMEIGSFRGYTAAAMATALPEGGVLTTIDIEPAHGVAYRDTPLAQRVDRRVGSLIETTRDEANGSFDLVFIDADHRYEAVQSDTEAAQRLVAPKGWMVWHDYSNWGYFNGACGVPEYLNQLGTHLPVVHLAGTNLAVHSPDWCSGDGRARLQAALDALRARQSADPWQTGVARP